MYRVPLIAFNFSVNAKNIADFHNGACSFGLFAEYAKNREKYPHLLVRCKPNQLGTSGNGGRFLSEMKIDWDCLDRCIIGANN